MIKYYVELSEEEGKKLVKSLERWYWEVETLEDALNTVMEIGLHEFNVFDDWDYTFKKVNDE